LAKKIKNGRVNRDRAIFPAFVFAKRNLPKLKVIVKEEDPTAFVYVRPFFRRPLAECKGVRASDWSGLGTVEWIAYEQVRANGMFPIFFGPMLDHETGHLSQFYRHPDLMMAQSDAYKAAVKRLNLFVWPSPEKTPMDRIAPFDQRFSATLQSRNLSRCPILKMPMRSKTSCRISRQPTDVRP